MPSSPRIFLSYSRADKAYAKDTRARIEAEGLSLWQDITHMKAGRWWPQIVEILENPATEHMVLLVSRTALGSEVVRREWRKARQEGVTVHPVIVPGTLAKEDFGAQSTLMPAWMRAEHFYDLEQPEQFTRLIEALKGPSKQIRVPMMAPEPDPDFVMRKAEGEALLGHLLAGENANVGITAALRGAGGYGKTALAQWLCAQENAIAFVARMYDEKGLPPLAPKLRPTAPGFQVFPSALSSAILTRENRFAFLSCTFSLKMEICPSGQSPGCGAY